jgi:hypothetical protein
VEVFIVAEKKCGLFPSIAGMTRNRITAWSNIQTILKIVSRATLIRAEQRIDELFARD